MKKVLYVLALLIGSFLLIGSVNAKIVETGLKETADEAVSYFGNKENFEDEQTFNAYQVYVKKITNADFSNYSESDDKVNIYIFRGKTCWHCLDEISWLSSQVKEYGKYFNVYTYEVWNNKDNSKLMGTVSKLLGETSDGVPYTVIGKQTYHGFSESIGSQILDEVKSQYESKDRYDIKTEVNLEDGSLLKEEKKNPTVMLILISIVIIAGIALIIYISKSK